MNINHLRYFQEVCRHLNVTKAAKEIHISQPSVTAAIKELEKELGYDLFHRVNHRIYLTDEGKEFLARTNDFLLEFRNFQTLSMEIGKNTHSLIKLGIPTVLSTFVLSKILPALNTLYPNIHLEIYEIPTFTGLDLILSDDIDLSIGIIDNMPKDKICMQELFGTKLVLAVNVNNPLANKKNVTNEMLLNQPFVIVPKGSYHFEEIIKKFPAVKSNLILHSNQVSTITYMLEHDLAATILYQEIFAQNPKITTATLHDPIYVNIGIIWNKNKNLSQAMKSFIAYMNQTFSKK